MPEFYNPYSQDEAVGADEQKEAIPEYHFEAIAELLPYAEDLVGQLKQNIEQKKYNVLISDDGGGRIPTLLIKKIINKVSPDQPLHTYFVQGGQAIKEPENLGPFYKRLSDINNREEDPSVLLVTQYIHSGESIVKFAKAIQEVGMDKLDVAALEGIPTNTEYAGSIMPEGARLFASIAKGIPLDLEEDHESFSGVKKPQPYRPYPETLIKSIEKTGRELDLEELNEIYGIMPWDQGPTMFKKMTENDEAKAEIERRKRAPLTSEEKDQIKENIRLARKDIDTLANQVISKVWTAEGEV